MAKACILIVSTILSFIGAVQAQSQMLEGSVTDTNAKGIESATVTLLRVADSSVTKFSITDKNGKYQFEQIAIGQYRVSVSAINYAKNTSDVISVRGDGSKIMIKTIKLTPIVKNLAGVTVTAHKPFIEQKLDRTIVNVDASIDNAGNSAIEVLEKSPGVTVDKDGNISLRGKSGVTIMIDGRTSNLSGPDLSALLRGMNASQLEQIEIMTNPPAKYDAAGNAGIINIKTKKSKRFGYNGNITTGYMQGRYARFNKSVNLNYRKGKVNIFSTFGFNRNHRGEDIWVDRIFRDATTTNVASIFKQQTNIINKVNFYSGKTGLDYYASKKVTFGLAVNGFFSDMNVNKSSFTDIFNANFVLDRKANAYADSKKSWKSFGTNAFFKTMLDSAGQELSGDIDYIQYKSTNHQPLYSSYFDKMGNLVSGPDTLIGTLPQAISIYSGKIDYLWPLKKGAKFEAGVKASYVRTDNEANYDTLRNNQVIHDYIRSNHFVYAERIYAGYVNYSRPLSKKWSGQFGLRIEHTNAAGNQITQNSSFTRSYTQLFPTVYLQYQANEKDALVLNYGRRINRPDYEDLNPFINFLDRYTFQQGNPNLKPQSNHNIELRYSYHQFINTTLNLSNTTDITQQVLEQNELTNETFIKKANIARQKQIGLTVNINTSVNKWWVINAYANIAYNHFQGVVNNEYVSSGLAMFMTQLQQQCKLGKGWSAEVNGFYTTTELTGVIFIRPFAQVQAGIGKEVFKGKGTLRLSARDIFNGSRFRGYSRYGLVDLAFLNINDNRAVGISFTWRFNRGQLKASGGKQDGGASEEQNRVKAGN